MNENIQELYNQAVSEASQELQEWNATWVLGTPRIDYESVLYKKFAELIVRECAWIVDNEGTSEEIFEHFGVEE